MRAWLRELRKSRDETAEHVAKCNNIATSTYLHYENNLRNPSVEVAKRLAQYYGIDWTLFFENENKKSTA